LLESEGKRKIDMVMEAYQACLKVLLRRSTKGEIVSPRYAIHLFAYNTEVLDVYEETLSIGDIIQKPLPRFDPKPIHLTSTCAAFRYALALLQNKMPYVQDFPAPVVCHLTDGVSSDGDPSSIVNEIRGLKTNDGPVLVSNIFVGDHLLNQPILDMKKWQGVKSPNQLQSQAACNLFNISSQIPGAYAQNIQKKGYSLQSDARMLIPATNLELVELAFAMSTATNT
jgi:hypothetical protein